MNHLHTSPELQGSAYEGNPTLMMQSLRPASQCKLKHHPPPIDKRQGYIWNVVNVQNENICIL